MKRKLIAALFAVSALPVYASNTQYNNEAGEQDFHAPIASGEQYRNEAGQQDQHFPQIG